MTPLSREFWERGNAGITYCRASVNSKVTRARFGSWTGEQAMTTDWFELVGRFRIKVSLINRTRKKFQRYHAADSRHHKPARVLFANCAKCLVCPLRPSLLELARANPRPLCLGGPGKEAKEERRGNPTLLGKCQQQGQKGTFWKLDWRASHEHRLV